MASKKKEETAVVVKNENELTTADITKRITEYMDAFGLAETLHDNEKKQFMEIATSYKLNPFKREIYCVAYGKGDYRKLSIITGYEVYLKRAERTGKLDGWKVDIFKGTNGGIKAKITINRKDWSNPFEHEVFSTEYSQNNKIWNEKPVTMIRKVAIAQGFRLAFPDELGGMPYTSDELPDEMTKPQQQEQAKVIETETVKTEPIDPEKLQLIEGIAAVLKVLCDGMSRADKDKYLEEKVKIKGWGELKDFTLRELDEVKDDLVKERLKMESEQTQTTETAQPDGLPF